MKKSDRFFHSENWAKRRPVFVMKRWPLLIIFIFIIIISVQNNNLITGSATTYSSLNIFANSSLYTEFTKYSPHTNATIEGRQFSANSIIELDIRNLTGSSVLGFPINVTTNSFGGFAFVWNVGNTSMGNYTILATDFNNSQLDRSRAIQILPPYSWIGRIINPENSSVRSDVFVYDEFGNLIAVDDEDYTLTFNYGVYYDIYIYPINVSGLELVHYMFMANEGPVGDILVIDDTANDAARLSHTDFIELFAVDPLIKDYEFLRLHLVHSEARNFGVYKCTDWNFTARTCNNNFTLIQNITDFAIRSIVNLKPGDPAIGIAYRPPVCGDGFCQPPEDYATCPQDCLAPSAPKGFPSAIGPAAVEVVPPVLPNIFYIGDFAKQQNFTVWVDLGETWIYTFKGVNHTVEEIRIINNSAELRVDYYYLTVDLGQKVQIDADQNDMPDIKFTLNQILGTKANITMELPPETMIIFKFIYVTPRVYYLLLAVFINMLIFDILFAIWWTRAKRRLAGPQKSQRDFLGKEKKKAGKSKR